MRGASLRAGSFAAPVRAALVALLLALAAFAPTTLAAADYPLVVAVKSRNLKLYDEVIEGFSAAFPEVRVDLRTMPPQTSSEDEQRRFAEQLERGSPALFLTLGARATEYVRREVPDVPVVYARVLAPIADSASDENLAGVRQAVSARSEARLLARLAPAVHRVAITFDPARSRAWLAQAKQAANEAGLEVVPVPASDKAAAAAALATIADLADAIWVPFDSNWLDPDVEPRLIAIARERRRPLLMPSDEFVVDGALASVYVDDHALGKRAAELAKRVLAGEPIAHIGVVDPPESIAINLKVATELGLTVPAEVLSSATKVER